MANSAGADRRYWTHSSKEKGSWRWWLHNQNTDIATLDASWRARLTGIYITRSDGGKISISLGLYWLWLSVGVRPPWTKRGNRKDFCISFHDGRMWWNIWRNDDSWSRDVPFWRNGNFGPVDTLLGRKDCTRRTIEERDVLVPMPEKSYPAKAQLIEFKWKRPRWPFAKTMLRVNIDIPGGIPHAGKGENSWDCGDDGTFGLTTGECKSIPEGVGILVGSCLQTRVRYGGWGDYSWKQE